MACMALQHPALITPEEAAGMLSVHPSTLARWVGEGKLHPVVLPSGRFRYRLAEIQAILEGTPAA